MWKHSEYPEWAKVEQIFQVEPEYQITVGDLAKVLNGFKASRDTLITDWEQVLLVHFIQHT
jgi:hypothetical protein